MEAQEKILIENRFIFKILSTEITSEIHHRICGLEFLMKTPGGIYIDTDTSPPLLWNK